MSAKWQPSDDELDALARTIEPPALDAEQLRTSVLAKAANVRQLPRSSPISMVVAVGTVAAAAAVLWFATRDTEHAKPRANVVAMGSASYEHERSWPSYVVSLDDGRVLIDVATVAPSERFAATTSDARIEVQTSRFIVATEQKRIASIDVQEGRVELTYSGSTIILAAGQSWKPPVRTAMTEVVEPPPSEPVVEVDTPKPPPRRKPLRAQPNKLVDATPPAPPPRSEPPEPAPVVSTPKPGELDFRAGVASLRKGDAAAATQSFASACAAARQDALGEDACFWVGAAAKRAGQTSAAREALTRFLQQFPSSARAGEASALLGWLLYEANELDAAEKRFDRAATDRVPKVRESAERGLEAIQRRRTK